MATVEQKPQFAVESEADTLLNRLSDVMAHFVLERAAKAATHTTKSGVPVVTEEDVKKTLISLDTLLETMCSEDEYKSDAKNAFRVWQQILRAALAPSETHAPTD